MIYISGLMLFALPWMEQNRRKKRAAEKCHESKDVCDKSYCENDSWSSNFVGIEEPSKIRVFCISMGQDSGRNQFEDQIHRGGRELF